MKKQGMKRESIMLVFCLLTACGALFAQETKPYRFEVTLNAGLNNSWGWEVEPEFFYSPFRYWGVGAGLAYTGMLEAETYSGVSSDGMLLWFFHDNRPRYAFSFRPKMKFSSPIIPLRRDAESGFSLSLYPGLIIPFPVNPVYQIDYIPKAEQYSGPAVKVNEAQGKGARTVYYSVKLQLNYHIDRDIALSLGYTLSDYDLYGGMRRLKVEGKPLELKRKQMMHLFTLGAAYAF